MTFIGNQFRHHLVAAKRTAFGAFGGKLAGFTATELVLDDA